MKLSILFAFLCLFLVLSTSLAQDSHDHSHEDSHDHSEDSTNHSSTASSDHSSTESSDHSSTESSDHSSTESSDHSSTESSDHSSEDSSEHDSHDHSEDSDDSHDHSEGSDDSHDHSEDSDDSHDHSEDSHDHSEDSDDSHDHSDDSHDHSEDSHDHSDDSHDHSDDSHDHSDDSHDHSDDSHDHSDDSHDHSDDSHDHSDDSHDHSDDSHDHSDDSHDHSDDSHDHSDDSHDHSDDSHDHSDDSHDHSDDSHDHDHDDHGHHHADPVEIIFADYAKSRNTSLTRKEFEDFFDEFMEVSLEGSEGGGAHAGHNHRRRDVFQDSDSDEECLDADELFDEYDEDDDDRLDEDELEDAMLEMVLMVLSGCQSEAPSSSSSSSSCDPPSSAEVWGFALLSTLLISVTAFAGLVIIPFDRIKNKKFILETMVSFAVGALFGDALLHLIPAALEVHSHGHDDSDDEEEDEKHFLWVMCVALASFLFFLFLERLFQDLFRRFGVPGGGHNHDLGDLEGQDEETKKQTIQSAHDLKVVGYLNLLADFVHNITDGLAIGAAYSLSIESGISTTLAIAFHEIPQELGDYAILIHAGFTKKVALLLNFLTACSAFIGTIVGVVVGQSFHDAEIWLLAFIAGNFLYIALVDMMPHLLKIRGWIHVALQFMGIIGGMTAMLLIGYFESENDC